MTTIKKPSAKILLILFVVMTLCAGTLLASALHEEKGIMPDHSAEYIRTQSRNSSIDADAVFYNPAGLAFMLNGGIFIMLNVMNEYRLQNSSTSIWGIQGVDTLNNNQSPILSRYLDQGKYSAKLMTTLPSDMAFIYKRNNWAVFSYFSLLQGVPGLTYSRGLSALDRSTVAFNAVMASRMSQQLAYIASGSSLSRNQMDLGVTVGGTYAPVYWAAQSLAVRYINMNSNTVLTHMPIDVGYSNGVSGNSYQSPTYIDTDLKGHGAGIIAGLDFKPKDEINIGLRFEYYPPMVAIKKTNRFMANPVVAESGQLNIFCDSIWPLVINDRFNINGMGRVLNFALMDPRTLKDIGNRLKVTYPPSVSVGFSYLAAKVVKLSTSVDIAFPRARDLDGRERDWNFVGYRLGQSVEWIINKWADVSVGYSYHDFGIKPGKRTEYDTLLPSHTVGAGATVKVLDFMNLTAAGSYSFETPLQNNTLEVIRSTLMGTPFAYGMAQSQKYSGSQWRIALGVTLSIFPVSADHIKKAEEHYWKGMSNYLSNDIDSAIDEFKAAQFNNLYYRDVEKKIKDLDELKRIMAKNKQQQEEEREDARKKGKKNNADIE
jgi:opacity protein-like surface antigen